MPMFESIAAIWRGYRCPSTKCVFAVCWAATALLILLARVAPTSESSQYRGTIRDKSPDVNYATLLLVSMGGFTGFLLLATQTLSQAGITKHRIKRKAFMREGMFCSLLCVVYILHRLGYMWQPSSNDFPQYAQGMDTTVVRAAPIEIALFMLLAVEPMMTMLTLRDCAVMRFGPERAAELAPRELVAGMALFGPLWVIPRLANRMRPTLGMTIGVAVAMFLVHLYPKRHVQKFERLLKETFPNRVRIPAVLVGSTLRTACDVCELLYIRGAGGVTLSTISMLYLCLLLALALLQSVLFTYSGTTSDELALLKAERDANAMLVKAKDRELAARAAAESARQRFMRYVFHEVRVPFNSLVIGLGLLEDEESSRLSADGLITLDMLIKSASAAKTLLNDVLDFAKIESGSFQISLVPTRLRELMNATVLSMTPMATDPDARVTIDTHVDHTLPAWVLADKVRLQQVVANLVSNAIKFAPHDGEGKVNIRVEVIPEQSLHVEDGTDLFILARDVPSQPDKSKLLRDVHWRAQELKINSEATNTTSTTNHSSSGHSSTLQQTGSVPRLAINTAPAATNNNGETVVTVFSPPASVRHDGPEPVADDDGPRPAGPRLGGWSAWVRSSVGRIASVLNVDAVVAAATAQDGNAAAGQDGVAVAQGSTRALDARPHGSVGRSSLKRQPSSAAAGGATNSVEFEAYCVETCLTGGHRLPALLSPEVQDGLVTSLAGQGFSIASMAGPGAPPFCPCRHSQPEARHCTMVISVQDNGGGITPAEAPLLFRAFRQLDAGLQYKGKGTGLGLAICHEIISLHGGRVGVRSSGKPGEGAEFVVLLRLPVLTYEGSRSQGSKTTTPSPSFLGRPVEAGQSSWANSSSTASNNVQSKASVASAAGSVPGLPSQPNVRQIGAMSNNSVGSGLSRPSLKTQELSPQVLVSQAQAAGATVTAGTGKHGEVVVHAHSTGSGSHTSPAVPATALVVKTIGGPVGPSGAPRPVVPPPILAEMNPTTGSVVFAPNAAHYGHGAGPKAVGPPGSATTYGTLGSDPHEMGPGTSSTMPRAASVDASFARGGSTLITGNAGNGSTIMTPSAINGYMLMGSPTATMHGPGQVVIGQGQRSQPPSPPAVAGTMGTRFGSRGVSPSARRTSTGTTGASSGTTGSSSGPTSTAAAGAGAAGALAAAPQTSARTHSGSMDGERSGRTASTARNLMIQLPTPHSQERHALEAETAADVEHAMHAQQVHNALMQRAVAEGHVAQNSAMDPSADYIHVRHGYHGISTRMHTSGSNSRRNIDATRLVTSSTHGSEHADRGITGSSSSLTPSEHMANGWGAGGDKRVSTTDSNNSALGEATGSSSSSEAGAGPMAHAAGSSGAEGAAAGFGAVVGSGGSTAKQGHAVSGTLAPIPERGANERQTTETEASDTATAHPSASDPAPSSSPVVEPRPLRILVVDDVPENRRLLARVLRSRFQNLAKAAAAAGKSLNLLCSHTGAALDASNVEVSEAEDGHIAVARITGMDPSQAQAVGRRLSQGGPGTTAHGGRSPEVHPDDDEGPGGNWTSIADPEAMARFDAITMDAEMPVMSGFTATRIIRAAGYSGPIFGCTGNSLPEDQELFKASGVDRVFVKPVAVQALVAAIAESLEAK